MANTQQVIEATREHLYKMAKQINIATNDMQGSPYWNKCKSFIKIYFKNMSIKEISANDFVALSGFKKDIALKMLIEINKEIFNNIN